ECRELGRRIGHKLSAATGSTALFVPLRGLSMIAVEGQPFHDAEADAALLEGLRETLDPSVEVHEVDADVNDPELAVAMAERLHDMIREGRCTERRRSHDCKRRWRRGARSSALAPEPVCPPSAPRRVGAT